METITIVPYNPKWPKIYKQHASVIQKALGKPCVAIHHFGSTAVSGLCAKPKIDILAAIPAEIC